MNWGKLRTVSSVDHMRCLTCPGIFLNVTFQAFVHHEWISTPAARVMAEVCWESQNLSGGNPNCLHGRTGLLVITVHLPWVCDLGLLVCVLTGRPHESSPVVLLESLESSISSFPWPWPYDTWIYFCWTAATLQFLLLDALFFLIGGASCWWWH